MSINQRNTPPDTSVDPRLQGRSHDYSNANNAGLWLVFAVVIILAIIGYGAYNYYYGGSVYTTTSAASGTNPAVAPWMRIPVR